MANIIGTEKFHLLYMDADIEYCKTHDPDHLYADDSSVAEIPGVAVSYDIPKHPVLKLKPDEPELNVERILEYLNSNRLFPLH